MEEDNRQGNDLLCLCLSRLNLVKLAFLHKVISKFSIIHLKNSNDILSKSIKRLSGKQNPENTKLS